MSSGDDPLDDSDEDDEALEESLRNFIQEELYGIHFFGFKKASLDDIKKSWPSMYGYLQQNYGDFLRGCTVAIKSLNKSEPIPFVLLPDGRSSVLTWDKYKKYPTYSQSEDMARFLERFK
jgi:hypothetical protein